MTLSPVSSPLDHIAIVLVETSHPGNLGATARAMKTMGLYHLRLVNPQQFPHADAMALAAGADDVLQQAQVYPDFAAAIADCHLVAASSARSRQLACPHGTPRELAPTLIRAAHTARVAVVFGRERIGLTNEELDCAQLLLHIPANPAYRSLNLASAVQLIAYELRLAAELVEDQPLPWGDSPPATHDDRQRLHDHLAQVLRQIEFLDDDHPRQLERRLRRLLNRLDLEHHEVQILRGILTHVQKHLRPPLYR